MSDIEDLLAAIQAKSKAKLQTLLPSKGSGWLSRKLLIGAGVVVAMLVLSITGRFSEIAALLWPIATVVCTYLVCQTAEDCIRAHGEVVVRKELVKVMAEGGLTDDERKALGL